MVAVMIIVGDEPLDAVVKTARQEVVLQQHAVLEVLMPSFVNARQAFKPAVFIGSFTTTLSAIFAKS